MTINEPLQSGWKVIPKKQIFKSFDLFEFTFIKISSGANVGGDSLFHNLGTVTANQRSPHWPYRKLTSCKMRPQNTRPYHDRMQLKSLSGIKNLLKLLQNSRLSRWNTHITRRQKYITALPEKYYLVRTTQTQSCGGGNSGTPGQSLQNEVTLLKVELLAVIKATWTLPPSEPMCRLNKPQDTCNLSFLHCCSVCFALVPECTRDVVRVQSRVCQKGATVARIAERPLFLIPDSFLQAASVGIFIFIC